MPQLEHDDIEALAQSVFGAKCRVLAWHPVAHGDATLVVTAKLAFPARVVALKLADCGLGQPLFTREATIQRRVARETAVPVCEVLAVDDSCQRFPWRYLMMAHAQGMSWRDGLARMTPSTRRDTFRQLGKVAAEMHNLRYSHFGEVEVMTSQGEGKQKLLTALAERARRRIANPAHTDLFVSVLEAHASDFAHVTEPCLTHEDLNPGNLLLVPGEDEDDDWRIAAVLDFGSAWSGCPESDLARLELWRDMMGDGFYESYTATQPIASDYPARRPIYQLLWCLEYAQPTAQHHADTAAVCARLGIPPVTFG